MTTLIAVYHNGKLVGRCDERCYNAECHECDCICKGRNHGRGKARALDNTREMLDEWKKDYEEKLQLGRQELQWQVPASTFQRQMFEFQGVN